MTKRTSSEYETTTFEAMQSLEDFMDGRISLAEYEASDSGVKVERHLSPPAQEWSIDADSEHPAEDE